MNRCKWAQTTPEMMKYHDEEWGIAEYNDQYLFEMLTLELFQSGLSWQTILNKRDAFKKAFDNFDVQKVKNYDDDKFNELMNNKGIIRNKLKINAAINNADVISEFYKRNKTFSDFIWSFTQKKIIINHYNIDEELPAYNELSITISKEMKRIGFKFVGPTTIYSFLQAAGVINDHIDSCDFK
ncbi:DNA-3-methyladenine glycosylase I [Companilactobacillus sp. DQM5]|uniref:DNA-3-methyladenine glycosylase I n=1 Tax=Companilactobacillus sp. DQM5 TaxID=3463359 RepID=UPI004058E2F0